jgi:ATP-dependent helicase/DNAse subunit B
MGQIYFTVSPLNIDLLTDFKFITPTRHAAKALNANPYSLATIAKKLLELKNLAVAPPLTSYQLLRETIREILTPQDLEGTIRTWMPTIQTVLQSIANPDLLSNSSQRARDLFHVVRKYQEKLRELNYVDTGEILWQAISMISQREKLCIYGYFDPRIDELEFIKAIASEDSIIYLPYQEEQHFFLRQKNVIEQLTNSGWKIHNLTVGTTPPSLGEKLAQQFIEQKRDLTSQSCINAHSYSSNEAESRGTLQQIKQLLHQGISANEIVVVAGDETKWGELFLDIAWEYQVPIRLPYLIKISDTRIGAWVTLLLEIIENNFPFDLTARMFSHPLSSPMGKEFWETVRTQRPTNFEDWQKVLKEQLKIDLHFLNLKTEAPRQGWLKYLTTVFEQFSLRKNAASWAKESVAYYNLIEGLQTLDDATDTISWTEFRNELLTSLAILKTPAYPGRGGVELHNPQTLMGTTYEYVFVIDVIEGTLPRPIKDDPILDFYERKRLKQAGLTLDDAADMARKEAFQFYALLHTPLKSFNLSYSEITTEGTAYRASEPSTYFQRLGLKPIAFGFDVVASDMEARQIFLQQPKPPELAEDPVLPQAIAAHTIEMYRLSGNPANEYAGVVGIPFDFTNHLFSASQLIKLGQCPFKWFASKGLGLSDLGEIEAELDVGLRGSLYHKVLELALKAYQENPQIKITDSENLLNWFKDAERVLNFPTFTAWEHQRQEHLKTLQSAMEQPEFLGQETTVLAVEQKIMSECYGLPLRGYIDRIDKTPQGIVVIDYKTSSKAPKGIKDATGEANIDMQLPIYQAAIAKLYPDETIAKALYYSLTKGKEIASKSPPEDELKAAVDRLKSNLSEGSYPIEPDLKREACRYCEFDLVCRKSEEEE